MTAGRCMYLRATVPTMLSPSRTLIDDGDCHPYSMQLQECLKRLRLLTWSHFLGIFKAP